MPDWERRACADPERVGRYWPSARHNVGLACGPSRLMVVDLDNHSPLPEDWRLPGAHDGRAVLALLAEWAGQPWPVTYTVKTPTGGLHLYYTSAAGQEIRNSAGKFGPLIDVRAAGGYVLAAGSVLDERAHPENPGCRTLVKGGRAYELADDSDPVPLPEWLAILARGGEPTAPSGGRPRRHGPVGQRLNGLINTVRAGKAGDRNGPLYWASCRAAEMIAAGELDREAAEEHLFAAAVEAGLRGGEREARRTFASAMRGGGL